jgi:hypothetical protein
MFKNNKNRKINLNLRPKLNILITYIWDQQLKKFILKKEINLMICCNTKSFH